MSSAPKRSGPAIRSPWERFWGRVVVRENGCWEWTGGQGRRRNGGRDGRFRTGGRKAPVISPHRQVTVWAYGPPPDVAMQACHTCPEGENDLCVNPAHLRWGSKVQNEMDKERYVSA